MLTGEKSGSDKKLTPLMQQYWEIKNAHLDKVLLFRMGDFFEMFHDDAVRAAPILGIALTQRNKKAEDETPMCGMPHHSIAGPINRLLETGHKVAICDQVEDPKEAKGIVRRAVTRILSPGMVYDPDTLDQFKANYLCAFDDSDISFLETTTGEAFYYSGITPAKRDELIRLLNVSEILVLPQQKETLLARQDLSGPHITIYASERKLSSDWPASAQRLLAYACEMQGEEVLAWVKIFERRELDNRVTLSAQVVRHLEIFATYQGEREGSLFQAINRTKTSAGARLLKQWIRFPLCRETEIKTRQDQVGVWTRKPEELKQVRASLARMGDVERRLGKISSPQCHARDLIAIADSMAVALELAPFAGQDLSVLCAKVGVIVERIRTTIVDEPPIATHGGGIIRQGLDRELDELIVLSTNSQKSLLDMEMHEREKTGISSLKIRYNNVFGYYIEVTNTHLAKVPEHYRRKQTLSNAERYMTGELRELETKVLTARTRRAEVEWEFFSRLRQEILQQSPQLLSLARVCCEMDVLTALAWLAIEQNYVCPQFSGDRTLELRVSRHPVVEQKIEVPFVANDIELPVQGCLLITGPNMAGKSTLMRQVAISAIMAQMGSFVPASRASLPIFEKIFTRIGASDFLAQGLSTFMVEMTETAEILRDADENSLVIIDEIGRGTSTYDGMSLAQAILEYLVSESRAMTFFSTHYHELTSLEQSHERIINGHMTVVESKGEIRFLHTLARGATSRSYGIQVAQLAGVPLSVIKRSQKVLQSLETGKTASPQMSLLEYQDVSANTAQEPVREDYERFIAELKQLTVQSVTPLEALNKIAEWQRNLS